MATRLHERGSRNKVSIIFEKGSREERKYIPKCAPREFALFVFLAVQAAAPCHKQTLSGPAKSLAPQLMLCGTLGGAAWIPIAFQD